jgi:hypothetical protein
MAKGGPSKAFTAALARPVLNRLATIPVFQQGQELLQHRRVVGLLVESDEAAASIEDHLARLWMEDGFLQYECPCERGAQGLLCAHGVAVALAALAPKAPTGKAKPKAKTIDVGSMDKILREQSSDTLAGLLLNWARQDDRLMQHLMTFAAQEGGFALDLRAYRAGLKKRLKKPIMSARPSEWKTFAKTTVAELQQIEGMIPQGQSHAALELSSEILMLLFSVDQYSSHGLDSVVTLVPQAFNVFVAAARHARPDTAVLIPHLLKFYRNDLPGGLEMSEGQRTGDWPMLELLGPAGRKALATAAEAQVHPPRTLKWEERTAMMRLARLAQSLYMDAGDHEGVERVIFALGGEDPQEVLMFARQLMQKGEAERAIGFLQRAQPRYSVSSSLEAIAWVLVECHLDAGDAAGAFAAARPLDLDWAADVEALRKLSERFKSWDQLRALMLADDPPGTPAMPQRPQWRFAVHMMEKDHASAWRIAKDEGVEVDPLLAGECALAMRKADPANAARVLAAAAEPVTRSERHMRRGIGYVDAACALVIEQGVRPENLVGVVRSIQQRFGAYGNRWVIAPHEPLWNQAVSRLLAAASPSQAWRH